MKISTSRCLLAVAALTSTWVSAGAQSSTASSATRCDTAVAASRADSVPVSIYLRTVRLDGNLSVDQSLSISRTIAAAFVAPRPFRVSTFSGASQMRVLRRVAPDTAGELRPPTLTGVYRYAATKNRMNGTVETVRTSMVPGFDSAAADAITSAMSIKDVRDEPDGDVDVIRLEVRFSTDSSGAAQRIAIANFPRMPVVDAIPNRDNPPPVFPAAAKDSGYTTAEVVLRFVVDPTGEVVPRTVEVARATTVEFLKSALDALPRQHFSPATIRGCPVAQVVDYAFSFVLPAETKPPNVMPRRD
ncbi:MAG: energy transducer TonB [Gemmatimonadaceae bacterium]